MNNVRPQMKLLEWSQMAEEIHQYTLKLLATTGVRVTLPSAVEMLTKRVGRSNVEEEPCGYRSDVVEWAIKAAPIANPNL
ncbi:MAG: hypothetical protein U0X87_07685 [Anaerolineales bacterium]